MHCCYWNRHFNLLYEGSVERFEYKSWLCHTCNRYSWLHPYSRCTYDVTNTFYKYFHMLTFNILDKNFPHCALDRQMDIFSFSFCWSSNVAWKILLTFRYICFLPLSFTAIWSRCLCCPFIPLTSQASWFHQYAFVFGVFFSVKELKFIKCFRKNFYVGCRLLVWTVFVPYVCFFHCPSVRLSVYL